MVDKSENVIHVHAELVDTDESHVDYISIDEAAGLLNGVVAPDDVQVRAHCDGSGGNESPVPMDGVGCMQGWARDPHLALTILTVGLILVLILMVTEVLPLDAFAVIESIIGAMYLWNVFRSSTFQYLRNIDTTGTVLDYMNQMYRTEPVISWFIQCYHHEKTRRIVSSPGPNGTTVYRTETSQKRINTHSAHGKLNFVRCVDISVPLDRESIEAFTMTKISIDKFWRGDQGAENQKNRFILFHRRDAFYDFRETLELPGYRAKVLGFVDLENIPALAHWSWYVVSHLTVVFGVPYRMWFSSKSNKVHTTIGKQIFTS